MHIYMLFICFCVYMWIFNMHTYMYMCVCVYTCTFIFVYVYVFMCIFVCAHACVHLSTWMYMCRFMLYICIQMCFFVCTCINTGRAFLSNCPVPNKHTKAYVNYMLITKCLAYCSGLSLTSSYNLPRFFFFLVFRAGGSGWVWGLAWN